MSKNSLQITMSQRLIFVVFLLAKAIRYTFFISFLYFIVKGTDTLAGYTTDEIILFYLTFTFIEASSQFLYREVYRFRPLIISGDFDLVMVKPFSALFRALMGGADIIDLVTIPPIIAAIWFVGSRLAPTSLQIILYIMLLLNALLIATGFYILVLSLGIITLEVDHTTMIFRDLVNLGRLPVDIYKEPLKSVLTFIVPLGIMITLPSRVLMGFVTPINILGSFLIAGVFLFISVKFWNFALTKYTSASS